MIQGFVVGNLISGNDGYGISQLFPYAAKILNLNNGAGPQVENSFDLGGNVCNDDFICPSCVFDEPHCLGEDL